MATLGTTLRLVLVSEDWFARSLMEFAARESGFFEEIISVDDGYSALAETWEAVASAEVPNVYLIDKHSVGPSAERLVAELRADPITRDVYVAVLTPDEPVAKGGIDFAHECEPANPELCEIVASVAARAMAARRTAERGRAA